jgi:phage tail sheath protein FI
MPEQTEPADETEPDEFDGPSISAYGVASAALGALCIAAIALGAVIWVTHRSDVDERHYQSRVMQAALDWTAVLINMNTGNVKPSLQRLHDGTVGELNADFDSAMQPYQQVVQRLQSTSHGQVEAVAVEAVRHDPDAQPGAPRPAPADQLPASVASRTDSVMVVATSVSENAGGKPQTVHWNLRLGVSDVDGKLMISRLESIR